MFVGKKRQISSDEKFCRRKFRRAKFSSVKIALTSNIPKELYVHKTPALDVLLFLFVNGFVIIKKNDYWLPNISKEQT